MSETITCAGCGTQVDIAQRRCPACNMPVARSRKQLMGKKRLLLAVILVLLAGYGISFLQDKEQGKPAPAPHQVLDAPQ